MTKIIDGKEISKIIRAEQKEKTALIKKEYGITPGLAVVLVGDDPASQAYVRSKRRACKHMGIISRDYNFPPNITEQELLKLIAELNADNGIHGILIQLPLPAHINENKILLSISPDKDVDGFHPQSLGKLVIGMETFFSCTPFGIIKLLEYSGISIEGKHVCIVGRSNIVGKPIANLLLRKDKTGNATVTICHSKTIDISYHTKQADIVIAAIGKPEFITADMIKEDAIVIDVGINRVENSESEKGYILVGDVDFKEVSKKTSYITPVPGG
ncbi:MAG: bifunctional 5,10-methylene-tetrahydrofolate dehydrogenase/5,10-methylene-tetrahydrofolate cyclohydrolase, partial [Candidatus Brocadiales bacterium]|nr:bifunctional 5,10-methylene-tetrahydrofolate dehydrogenase/5,10-methylene-tetrahydrofolate cyclohydrolase [Candidatus Brocadiales bacterium]